jgi:hypothetical protein
MKTALNFSLVLCLVICLFTFPTPDLADDSPPGGFQMVDGVPVAPAGTSSPDNHGGGREVFAGLLQRLANDYNEPTWAEAAVLFKRSAQELEKLTNTVVDFLLRKSNSLDIASASILEIADVEEQAFRVIRGA